MIGFFKKLFGRDADTNKEAGVQIEQIAPTLEAPKLVVPEPVVTAPTPVSLPKKAPAKQGTPKKQGGARPKTARKPRQPK